jgi:DNA-3-methyladenine glycosylase
MKADPSAPFDASALRQVPSSFFLRSPEEVAQGLLGCVVASDVGGSVVAGIVVETEAYLGAHDPGSHAATKGVTARNAVMYGPPGTAYVYFTYGNHHMLNLVCEPEGVAGAVLVRALRPIAGAETMTRRRHGRRLRELCNGPGKLAEALGIDLSDNGTPLGSGRIAVYFGESVGPSRIGTSGRVGLSRGHDLPLRYFIVGDPFVSAGRTGHAAPKRRPARQEGAS